MFALLFNHRLSQTIETIFRLLFIDLVSVSLWLIYGNLITVGV